MPDEPTATEVQVTQERIAALIAYSAELRRQIALPPESESLLNSLRENLALTERQLRESQDRLAALVAPIAPIDPLAPFTLPPPLDILATHVELAKVTVDMAMPKKCNIEHVFGRSIIDLLKLAPKNDTVRALVLAKSGLAVPATCETYEQVRDWFEQTYVFTGTPVVNEPDRLVFDVEVDGVITGYQRFTQPVQATGQFTISSEELQRLIEGTVSDEGSLGDLVNRVDRYIRQHVHEQIALVPNEDAERQIVDENFEPPHVHMLGSNSYDLLREYVREHHPEDYEALASRDE